MTTLRDMLLQRGVPRPCPPDLPLGHLPTRLWRPILKALQSDLPRAQLTLRDAATLTEQQLLAINACGRTSIGVLKELLAEAGLALRVGRVVPPPGPGVGAILDVECRPALHYRLVSAAGIRGRAAALEVLDDAGGVLARVAIRYDDNRLLLQVDTAATMTPEPRGGLCQLVVVADVEASRRGPAQEVLPCPTPPATSPTDQPTDPLTA